MFRSSIFHSSIFRPPIEGELDDLRQFSPSVHIQGNSFSYLRKPGVEITHGYEGSRTRRTGTAGYVSYLVPLEEQPLPLPGHPLVDESQAGPPLFEVFLHLPEKHAFSREISPVEIDKPLEGRLDRSDALVELVPVEGESRFQPQGIPCP